MVYACSNKYHTPASLQYSRIWGTQKDGFGILQYYISGGKSFFDFFVFFLSIGRQVSRAIIMVSNKRRNQTQLFEA